MRFHLQQDRVERCSVASSFGQECTQVSEHESEEVADLQRTIESLQEECLQKEHFIATLAHELRNPITALRAAVHLQDLSGDDPELRRKTFDIIGRQTTHMERLIDDLMDVSWLSRGKVSLEKATIDLTSVVAQVLVDQQKSFADVGVELTIELGDEPMWIEADVTRLTQVLSNLLSNARKATSSGDRVSVAVREDADQDQVVLSVSDTGRGIDAGEAERIFDRFVQASVDQARVERRGDHGLGLGLAIVQGIVELHGGHVEAHSAGHGQGATFVVRLPSSQPAEHQAHGDPALESIHERRVLIVEDDRDVAQLLVQLLELEGHSVELAYDAEEALEKLKDRELDTILCDLQLPGAIDGYELCRAVKIDPRFDSVRLVAMTGRGGQDARELSFGSGFDEHLTKPVDLDELRRAFKACN
jgi:signal transduction histidine kinase